MNLSARESEYMLMQTLGYEHKKIMLIHIKETVMQAVLAVPFGILAGLLLINAINSTFSNSNFVMAVMIKPQSFVLSIGILILITVLTSFGTSKQINNLNIVEGLKAQE